MESTILRIELNRVKSEKQILESKILEFYTKLDTWDHLKDDGFVKDKYQEHFEILIDRQGYIK
jgi:predicted translin family RNA/ssDNA-binding protein